MYVNVFHVRKLVHKNNRHLSQDFLKTLDGYVGAMVIAACKEPDGHYKRLSGTALDFALKRVAGEVVK